MIYLKLQSNKILKMNQTASVYEGENLADGIKVDIADIYENKDCFLNIFASAGKVGDLIPISDGDIYYLDNKFLTTEQDLIIWIEVRDEQKLLLKSSEIILKVNKHHRIDSIITDVEISAFEEMITQATALNKETKQLKTEIENIVITIPNLDEINKKLEELESLKKELEESLNKLDNIPTKLSQLENDVGYITIENIPTKVSELENDANYLSPDNLTPEIVEELKTSLNQEVISF